ncbi:MAG: ABC transporter permease [Microbacterium sp.]|nr:ABC transporter permease [Microbacterium sp.]
MAFAVFAPADAPTAAPNPQRRGGLIAFALLLPGLAYLGLFFLVPFVSLIITSLGVPSETVYGVYDYGLNFANYGETIATYWPFFLRSFWYALLATAIALVVGYPIAYFIGVQLRDKPLLKNLLLVLVIAPFFISFLLRTLAWKQLFSDEGPVVSVLQALSLLGPQDHLTGTPFSVVFGLTYNFLPFMVLPLYTSLERLDTRLIEASGDLYSSPATTFRTVTLPLTLPGIVSGTLLTFIPISGDFVNASPAFLGGTGTAMIGNVIQQSYFRAEYPAAAALSIMLMAIVVVIVAIYVRRAGTDDLL